MELSRKVLDDVLVAAETAVALSGAKRRRREGSGVRTDESTAREMKEALKKGGKAGVGDRFGRGGGGVGESEARHMTRREGVR